jgi:tetratricopeptide (TPR) repeat protein
MSTTQSFQSSHLQPYPCRSATSVPSQAQERNPVREMPSRGEYEAAIAHCNQMIAQQPENVEAWYERGEAQANLGRYAEAIASFDQVLSLKPQHVAALVFRAVACIHLGAYQEALLDCNMALAAQPRHAEAWLYRGVALRYLKRYQEAYVSYDKALGVRRASDWRSLIAKLRTKISATFPQWRQL